MRITNIQRFSLDDGPGIRTTVFLAGCNMRCLWCHNPEAFESIMLAYDAEKCVSCGCCEYVCQNGVHAIRDGKHKVLWEKCRKCLRCIDACKSGALFQNSRDVSIAELLTEISKDKHFYQRSLGGVTFSGGEPVLWSDELQEVLSECKKNGIHTAIETAGNYSFDLLERLLEYTDLVIMDCKAYSEELHKKLTGQSNQQVLFNMERLSKLHKRMWVRIPVVWNMNIDFVEMEKIARFLEGKQIEKVELLPYHRMGIGKYKMYGQEYLINDPVIPTQAQLERCYQILSEHTVPI